MAVGCTWVVGEADTKESCAHLKEGVPLRFDLIRFNGEQVGGEEQRKERIEDAPVSVGRDEHYIKAQLTLDA